MRALAKTLALFTVLTSLITIPAITASAESEPAYNHDSTSNYSAPNWMKNIPGKSPLDTLSIPGTHDTMSNGPGGDITQNQSLNLATQLQSGIRFLDIRLRQVPGEPNLYLHHGPVYLNASIGDVMQTVTAFLRENSSETVIMRVKQEWSTEPASQFEQTLEHCLQPYKDELWQDTNGTGVTTPLNDLRGKVVILQDEFTGLPWGIPYGASSDIQDNYNLTSVADQYNKWTAVKSQLDTAQTSRDNRDSKLLYMNYLSGSGGALPYFVASGKIAPETDATLLPTGLTTPAFQSAYPDFPRTGCFLGMCTISYEGTNQLAADHIAENKLNKVGVVIADFPGPALIDAVIKANNQVK